MPSALHEAIVELFRQRPALAAELLRESLAVALPAFTSARIESATFATLAPAEYRADLAVLLSAERAVLGIVVEVQLRVDPDKHQSWPIYAVTLRARLGCPTCVLVYTPDADVAAWAATPIVGGPGWSLQPFVLGPDLVPVITRPDEAEQRPELAVLSALAHGKRLPPEEAARVATVAVRAAAARDDRLALLYYNLVVDSLPAAARKAFEAMNIKDYEFKTDFARKYLAEGREEGIAQGRHQGRQEGKAEGRQEGKAEGRQEGKAEGRQEGKAEAVLQVLAARGIAVPETIRQRILACGDAAALDRWIRRAAVAANADEVMAGDS